MCCAFYGAYIIMMGGGVGSSYIVCGVCCAFVVHNCDVAACVHHILCVACAVFFCVPYM